MDLPASLSCFIRSTSG